MDADCVIHCDPGCQCRDCWRCTPKGQVPSNLDTIPACLVEASLSSVFSSYWLCNLDSLLSIRALSYCAGTVKQTFRCPWGAHVSPCLSLRVTRSSIHFIEKQLLCRLMPLLATWEEARSLRFISGFLGCKLQYFPASRINRGLSESVLRQTHSRAPSDILMP